MAVSSRLKILIESQEIKFKFFSQLVALEPNDWMKQSENQLHELIARNDLALNNSTTLQSWLDYVRIREQVVEMGLVKLIMSVEQGDILIQQLEDAHKAGIYDMLARAIAKTIINSADMYELELSEEYENSVHAHEFIHFISANQTSFKRAISIL